MAKLEYNNIFDAITGDETEAAELKFRADMMIAMRGYFEDRGWNQAKIAAKLGIPQPRVSELVNGKIHTLSADKLLGYMAKIGFFFKPIYTASTAGKRGSIGCKVVDCTKSR